MQLPLARIGGSDAKGVVISRSRLPDGNHGEPGKRWQRHLTPSNYLAACPAADTLLLAGGAAIPTQHPAKLRIKVTYVNGMGAPKNGVPPESVWVDLTLSSGNLKVVNETTNGSGGWRVFAEDST